MIQTDNKINIRDIDYSNPDLAVVRETALVLKQGGLVVAPTETRYGLLVRADQEKFLNRLYVLKKRPVNMPSAVFIPDMETIKQYAHLAGNIALVAAKFLPGPLTMVLDTHLDTKSLLIQNNKIGLRISSAPFISTLLKEIDFPVTATSANISGQQGCDSIDAISALFGSGVNLYINAGELINTVSTVVYFSASAPVLLREGAIAFSEINKVWDNLPNG